MKKIIGIITVIMFGISCQENSSAPSLQSDLKSGFLDYIDNIPLLDLPFEINSSTDFEHVKITSTFIPEGAALIGKLKPQNGLHLIIYSYPADIRLPILEVYDNEGVKLKQRELFNYGECPLTGSGHSRCIINDNGEIYIETACDTYFSKIDRDTVYLKELLIEE